MNKSPRGRRLAEEEWHPIEIHTDFSNFQSTPAESELVENILIKTAVRWYSNLFKV